MAKKEIEMNKMQRYSDLFCECTTDFVLPDFNGDIRKVLLFSAKAYPVSSFPDGGVLECSGNVEFSLIYANFEGEVESTNFSGEYSFRLKCDEENLMDSFVETHVSATSLRLLSPRKICAKAALESRVELVMKSTLLCEGTGLESVFSPQILEGEALISSVKSAPSHEFEFSETVATFDDKTVDDVYVLASFAQGCVEQIEESDSGVTVKGKIKLTTLIKTDDTPIYKVTNTVPFEEKIDSNFKPENILCRLTLKSLQSSVNGTDYGTNVSVSGVYEIHLFEEQNTTYILPRDSYVCTSDVENTYSDFSYEELLLHVKDSWEYSSVPDLDSSLKLRDCIYTSATPKILNVNISENTLHIDGEIRAFSIGSEIKNDETLEFTNLKFAMKFEKNVNLSCQNQGKIKIIPSIKLSDAFLEVGSDGVIFKANLALEARIFEEKSFETLATTNVREDLPFEKNPSRITVYYPESGDTIYSVAKEFHTTKSSILEDNPALMEIGANSDMNLENIKKIIIT